MPKRTVLPTIVAHYDEDGIVFTCEGETIEDVELGWEDLQDSELVLEVAEELVEYIDGEELEDIENPLATARRVIRQLANSKVGRRALRGADDDDEDDAGDGGDDYDDDEDY